MNFSITCLHKNRKHIKGLPVIEISLWFPLSYDGQQANQISSRALLSRKKDHGQYQRNCFSYVSWLFTSSALIHSLIFLIDVLGARISRKGGSKIRTRKQQLKKQEYLLRQDCTMAVGDRVKVCWRGGGKLWREHLEPADKARADN